MIKINKFCVPKYSINSVQRQPMKWKKMLVNHVFDKELISRIYKELLQLNNNKKTNNLSEKWIKDLTFCYTDF